jgi:nucleotide-binding universal stress UspA family protein
MLNVRQIVFPTDFSERSTATVPFVKAMACRFHARVILTSVIPPFWHAAIGEPGAVAMVDTIQLKNDLEQRLAGTFVRELQGVPVRRIAALGDPALAITDLAHSENADLIMMPTHGYGPFRSLLLGSVTAKVLHDARCPVWTNAHAEALDAATHVPARNILCALDGGPQSVPLLEWAADFVDATGANLRVVHAVAGIEGWPERQLNREFEEALQSQAKDRIQKQMDQAGINAALCVSVGEVPSVIREEARRHNADLVIIGRGVMHEKLGRLRTLSYGIIRHAPCPVLSV